MASVADSFYNTPAWKACRKAFRQAKGGLCERCLAKGKIVPGAQVHHKIRLTAENLDDPKITLSWSNLELLCAECHELEHGKIQPRTDKFGHVEIRRDPPYS